MSRLAPSKMSMRAKPDHTPGLCTVTGQGSDPVVTASTKLGNLLWRGVLLLETGGSRRGGSHKSAWVVPVSTWVSRCLPVLLYSHWVLRGKSQLPCAVPGSVPSMHMGLPFKGSVPG